MRVHTEFIQAGARVITTCSYGTAAANAITQKRSAGERARRQIPLAAATATAYVRSVYQTGAALRSVSQSRAQRSGAQCNAMRRIGFAGAFGPIGVAACHAMPCHAISRVRCLSCCSLHEELPVARQRRRPSGRADQDRHAARTKSTRPKSAQGACMTAPCTCARCPRVACCSASCACGPDYAAAAVAHDVPRGRPLYERDRAPRQTRGLAERPSANRGTAAAACTALCFLVCTADPNRRVGPAAERVVSARPPRHGGRNA